MITKKNVNKLQNAVIKENAANLVGAVKLYNSLFANGADLKAICKALEIPAEYLSLIHILCDSPLDVCINFDSLRSTVCIQVNYILVYFQERITCCLGTVSYTHLMTV